MDALIFVFSMGTSIKLFYYKHTLIFHLVYIHIVHIIYILANAKHYCCKYDSFQHNHFRAFSPWPQLLPSGRPYRTISDKTTRDRNSIFSHTISQMNS